MDRASSLIFPGSRTLAGWWRQLAAQQPVGLWVGYAFLHRIEAPVLAMGEQPVEPLPHLILQAIALELATHANHAPGVNQVRLQERLGFPAPVVQRLLLEMQQTGLLTRPTADRWQLSAQGQIALERQAYPVQLRQRRVFTFLERLDLLSQRVDSPHFAPIGECVGVSWPVDDAHRFDVAALKACVEQPAAWKQGAGFPLDVQAPIDDPALEPWQSVIVDRPERVMLLMMAVKADSRMQIRGFAVKVDGWTLYDREPVLAVEAETAGRLWSELAAEPTAAIWQDAWRGWCRQRQLPANEVEICSLSYQPPRLEVQAPSRLVQRLQAAKSDLFKGDAWLLVGEGYIRTAVQIALKG